MKANILTDWERLELKDVPKPIPEKNEVLIRVTYAGICGSDSTVFHHRHMTATVPGIMGHEILGVVEEINSDMLLNYKVGDRVVVHPLLDCGNCPTCLDGKFHVCESLRIMGLHVDGAFAEYLVAEAKRVFPVAEDIPDKIAILTEPLAVGFHACMRAAVQPEENVLIIGGGPIGIMTAIAARYFRANIVVAEIQEARLELCHSLGFETIDVGKNDLIESVCARTNGRGYDAVFEVSASASGYQALPFVTKICGKAVIEAIPSALRAMKYNAIALKEISVIGTRVHTLKDFQRTVEMLEYLYRSGSIHLEKLVSAVLPLADLEAGISLQEAGTETGKIIIRI